MGRARVETSGWGDHDNKGDTENGHKYRDYSADDAGDLTGVLAGSEDCWPRLFLIPAHSRWLASLSFAVALFGPDGAGYGALRGWVGHRSIFVSSPSCCTLFSSRQKSHRSLRQMTGRTLGRPWHIGASLSRCDGHCEGEPAYFLRLALKKRDLLQARELVTATSSRKSLPKSARWPWCLGTPSHDPASAFGISRRFPVEVALRQH